LDHSVHRRRVLRNHEVWVQTLQAVVCTNVLDVRIVPIGSEEIKVALLWVLLDHGVLEYFWHFVTCKDWLIVVTLGDLLNYGDEETRSVLVVGHYTNAFVQF